MIRFLTAVFLLAGLLAEPLSAHEADAGHAAHPADAVPPPGASGLQGPKPMAARSALAVSAAYAPDGRLWLVGVDGAGRLFVQRSADAGRHWTPAEYPDTAGDVVAAEGENR